MGSVFRQLLMSSGSTQDWQDKPADWSDIRKDCPANSIALYAGHSADYSQYDNLGFTATCTGGYKVYIDRNVYGSYSSGSTCNITWSTSGITTGDTITTPSALKAHKIWIEPATSGNNITAFKMARVAASGNEQQGVLWAHFNLTNEISLASGFGTANNYQEAIMRACTAKGNTIKIKDIQNLFINTSSLEYSAVLDNNNNSVTWYSVIRNSGIPEITIKNGKPTSLQYFAVDSKIENLNFINCDFSSTTNISGAFGNTTKIKKFPEFNFSSACLGGTEAFLSNCSSLTEDYVLDLSNCSALNKIVIKQTVRFKGLRVSSSATFGGATPQINVSDTGMDRTALVQLFNDLPTVSGGQIVHVEGTTGSEDLTVDDILIANNKGWTVTGGPQPIPSWQLGDRLDNKASFVGYFDSVNPDDQSTQRYAYFVVDAQYRAKTQDVNNPFSINNAPIPVYTSVDDALAAKESATWTASKLGSFTNYPPFSKCNAVSVTFNGTTYYGVPPNTTELLAIRVNRTALDNADPTASTYSTLNLATWGQGTYGSLYTCQAVPDNSSSPRMTFWKKTNQNDTAFNKAGQAGNPNNTGVACPIIEIPVPAGHGA